jgi:hypothetical protein
MIRAVAVNVTIRRECGDRKEKTEKFNRPL